MQPVFRFGLLIISLLLGFRAFADDNISTANYCSIVSLVKPSPVSINLTAEIIPVKTLLVIAEATPIPFQVWPRTSSTTSPGGNNPTTQTDQTYLLFAEREWSLLTKMHYCI